MTFLIIIPAHNEETCILQCLESLHQQTYQDFRCVVVNDGSSDTTQILVEEFVKTHSNFKIINLDKSEHQPGAKVVRSFERGVLSESLFDVDILCKFDADIIFPTHYLNDIKKGFEDNFRIGMLSGLVYIQNEKKEWVFEDISSKDHVRGPIKAYRKACYQDMDGLRAVLGWDNIDVMLAQKSGWEVQTIKELWVKHLRPTAYKYQHQKAEKLGEYFYNIGLDIPLALISSAKAVSKSGGLSTFLLIMRSFFRQRSERVLTREEVLYIRQLRWSAMLQKYLNPKK